MSHGEGEVVVTTVWSAGPGCHGGCGVLAHVKDGKLIKVEGDPTIRGIKAAYVQGAWR